MTVTDAFPRAVNMFPRSPSGFSIGSLVSGEMKANSVQVVQASQA